MPANYIGYIISGFIVLFAIILAIYAQIKVQSTFSKYSDVPSKSGITGKNLAQSILNATGNQATLRSCRGHLTDHYNPVNHTVNISQDNINSSSVAGLGVVAHEMGHYLQQVKKYKPFYIRQAIVKVCNFTSGLLLPLLLIGMLLNIFAYSMYGMAGDIIIWIAVAIYGVSALANLATLPVEINASKRALKMLKGMNIMDEQELAQTKEVLSAAALTYVAALLVSLGYFLRLLFYALLITRDR